MQNYKSCNLCPHECAKADEQGKCYTANDLQISSLCVHKGEEPPVSGNNGIINIFFSNCNLHCVYCQNYQISRDFGFSSVLYSGYNQVLQQIKALREKHCINSVGLVSPSHQSDKVIILCENLKEHFPDITLVYNTNSYDKVKTLKKMGGLIDIYLPDFKYSDDKIAEDLSGAKNYSKTAIDAIGEMISQKGVNLLFNDDGTAYSGVIIRHLVLPALLRNSKEALNLIERNFGTSIYLSLLSQYNPVYYSDYINNTAVSEPDFTNNESESIMLNTDLSVKISKNCIFKCKEYLSELYPGLQRSLTEDEYKEITDYSDSLGFYRGWIQDMQSCDCYNPDFNSEDAFEKNSLIEV